MITDTLYLKTEYESTRLFRYQDAKRAQHSQEDFDTAYYEWANAPAGREGEWDKYCDIRDGYTLGTNAKIRRKIKAAMFIRH